MILFKRDVFGLNECILSLLLVVVVVVVVVVVLVVTNILPQLSLSEDHGGPRRHGRDGAGGRQLERRRVPAECPYYYYYYYYFVVYYHDYY